MSSIYKQHPHWPCPPAKFSVFINIMDGKMVAENKAWYTWPLSIPQNLGNLFTFGFLFAIFITQLFVLLVTVMKWCSRKQYRMLWLCGVHRHDLVLSTRRMNFCVVSIEAKISLHGFLTAYGNLLCWQLLPFMYGVERLLHWVNTVL